MSMFQKCPGAAPPRAWAAAAAVASTLLLHGAVLSLFRQASSDPWLLATPELDRRLERCQVASAADDRQRCRLAVAARAREASRATRLAAR